MVVHCFKEDYNIWFPKTKYVKEYRTNVLCRSQVTQLELKKKTPTNHVQKTKPKPHSHVDATKPCWCYIPLKTPNYSECRHLPGECNEPRNWESQSKAHLNHSPGKDIHSGPWPLVSFYFILTIIFGLKKIHRELGNNASSHSAVIPVQYGKLHPSCAG